MAVGDEFLRGDRIWGGGAAAAGTTNAQRPRKKPQPACKVTSQVGALIASFRPWRQPAATVLTQAAICSGFTRLSKRQRILCFFE